jgi:ABC exporter DevB family membrane fusion protein
MRRVIAIFLLGLAAGVGATFAYHMYLADDGAAPADHPAGQAANGAGNPAAAPRRSAVALGTLEPRDGVVQISSPLVGCQIKRVLVQDGQLVKAGDVLVELDSSEAVKEHELALAQRAEALALAQQRLATAQLAVKQATDGRDVEIAAQQSRIAVAAAKEKEAQQDADRLEEMRKLKEPLASQLQVDEQRVVATAAAAEHEAANLQLKRLQQTLLFQEESAKTELQAAQKSLAEQQTGTDSLNRRVELSELKLNQTKITAPAGGMVLSVVAHSGEVVAQQPLLQIADLDNLVCVAEVDAGEVSALQSNQKATVTCRAFHDAELEGTLDRVGSQITKATLRPLDPRKQVDRDVTKVVVLVDSKKAARLINSSGKDRRAVLVGLQVEVAFPLAGPMP